MLITIVNQATSKVPRKFVDTWMREVVRELQRRKVLTKKQAQRELTLVFLNRGPAKKINFEFRARAYATDVLSFDSMEPDSFGELILCPDVLKRQAKEHGLSYRIELGYMLLHGILHLLGYDHEQGEDEAREMFGLQDAVFEKLLKKLSI